MREIRINIICLLIFHDINILCTHISLSIQALADVANATPFYFMQYF